MNLASWVILLIVVAILGLAVRATFFSKKKSACCDLGDAPSACSAEKCAACSCAGCNLSELSLEEGPR